MAYSFLSSRIVFLVANILARSEINFAVFGDGRQCHSTLFIQRLPAHKLKETIDLSLKRIHLGISGGINEQSCAVNSGSAGIYGQQQDYNLFQRNRCPVGWGCRIHRLLLCRVMRPPNECPGYDTKQSDGEVPVVLELWAMWSIRSLPSLPGPLCLGVVAYVRFLSSGQIELNYELLILYLY